ncbi:MAG: hypothetical protein FWC95_04305 [Defluviitaleaceae bacterium]|nr:hypothetical protein [Defluviitaleaceae bacterium]
MFGRKRVQKADEEVSLKQANSVTTINPVVVGFEVLYDNLEDYHHALYTHYVKKKERRFRELLREKWPQIMHPHLNAIHYQNLLIAWNAVYLITENGAHILTDGKYNFVGKYKWLPHAEADGIDLLVARVVLALCKWVRAPRDNAYEDAVETLKTEAAKTADRVIDLTKQEDDRRN